MEIRFDNKVVLVTGASSGIGRAAAKEFAKSGAKVIVHYNESKSDAEQVVDSILNNDGDAIAIKADVSIKQEVDRLIKLSIEKYNTIDILINNAGALI